MEKKEENQVSKIKKIIEELKKYDITKQDLLLNFLQEEETLTQILDEKTIETLEKITKHLKEIKKTKLKTGYIPLTIFSDRTLSTLEHIITHLKEKQNLSYQEIATLLNRNPRTVWTTYQRAKKKRG